MSQVAKEGDDDSAAAAEAAGGVKKEASNIGNVLDLAARAYRRARAPPVDCTEGDGRMGASCCEMEMDRIRRALLVECGVVVNPTASFSGWGDKLAVMTVLLLVLLLLVLLVLLVPLL